MKIINRLEKIKQIDLLIRMKNTGYLYEFAMKIGLSESQTRRYIKAMQDMGADISFNRQLQTYHYNTLVKFNYGFTEIDIGKIFGGFSLNPTCKHAPVTPSVSA